MTISHISTRIFLEKNLAFSNTQLSKWSFTTLKIQEFQQKVLEPCYGISFLFRNSEYVPDIINIVIALYNDRRNMIT